ncbi:MAG: FeS-binding protein, partial [Gemmatimonadetes bacterium]|nr:FeS-binding protein [Gemmatimonadota bacterium]
GRMLTPLPFDLGLVIMGNNQVAVDSVCSRIIGLDPMEIEHIRLAHERGFGPTELREIDVLGDIGLDEASERASGFRTGLIRVEDYFEGTKIRAYSGPPPGGEDYCWGGCPGALEEAVEILRVIDQGADAKMPAIHIVFGRYEGEIPAAPNEWVVFIGDCASFEGSIGSRRAHVIDIYRDRLSRHPVSARHDDVIMKMFRTMRETHRLRSNRHIRLKGCPVSVAEQLLVLAAAAGIPNPYLAPARAIPFANSYFSWRTHSVLRRLRGDPYNKRGLAERGAAKTELPAN